MTRDPARSHYDAVVDLYPHHGVPDAAYALVKFTYDVSTGQPRLMEADPLLHDFRDEDVEHPLLPGSDFHFYKRATDVVVLGSAHPPHGRSATSMQVAVTVGDREVRVQVHGPRVVEWTPRGNPKFGAPQPFDKMPVVWEEAYGGADQRVPVEPEPESPMDLARLEFDHPGLYPRNPFGKGYVVKPDPIEGIPLPNLEDPRDPLTEERFLVEDPRSWYRQPRPVALSWTHPLMFPRFVYLGADAWYPAPEDARLPEVRSGILEAGYRERYIENDSGPGPALPYYQEAHPDLVFAELPPGTPLRIEGMHPGGRVVRFEMPRRPRLGLEIEGRYRELPPRLTGVLVEPEREQMAVTYSVVTADLPRKYVPGVHGHIPLALQVHGDEPVRYRTPPTLRQQLEAAEDEQAEDEEATDAGAAEEEGRTRG